MTSPTFTLREVGVDLIVSTRRDGAPLSRARCDYLGLLAQATLRSRDEIAVRDALALYKYSTGCDVDVSDDCGLQWLADWIESSLGSGLLAVHVDAFSMRTFQPVQPRALELPPSETSDSEPAEPLYEVRIRFRHYKALRYQLELAGRSESGVIGAGSTFLVELPSPTTTGELRTWPPEYSSFAEAGEAGTIWELSVGDLEAPTAVRGAQCRLNNLGYQCGANDGELGEFTLSALASFRHAKGLEAEDDGLGAATPPVLLNSHGV